MVRLILSGGGVTEDSKLLDELFVKLIPRDKDILYIPIAIDTNKHPYNSCFGWINSVFNPLGFDRIVMWTDLANKKYEDLAKFSSVYIGGGNTFKLLHNFRKTGFYDLLKRFIGDNKIVYGGSAGAIIFGKSIGTALLGKNADENIVGLQDLSSFNLVKDYCIRCHYTENDDSDIFEYIEKNNSKVIALTERSGLFVKDNKIKVVGYEPAYVFENRKKIMFEPGSNL